MAIYHEVHITKQKDEVVLTFYRKVPGGRVRVHRVKGKKEKKSEMVKAIISQFGEQLPLPGSEGK